MRKVLLVLLSVFMLSACGGKSEMPADAETEESVSEKNNEMTATAALNYLEQITERYLNSVEYEDGSFEQKSELQAGIKRCEAIISEIEEKYKADLPIATEMIDLANGVKNTLQDMLDGDNNNLENKNHAIGILIGNISGEYLDGELPPTLKYNLEMDKRYTY
ncbi:hypothetical protein [Shouchella clausii]|uniref:hypothetical protein n=1 Tax=Shouchella clausii TaxID=79880 RepID=UPI0011551BDD|nr:hypothetical protein [Shouchella clausii]MCR1290101.1 hypothetical protein [Shouchella clausii]MEB5475223.1 hypothetical protein [Shouchella clausii]WQG97196.1 hypothetical protein SR921_10890 [Shouchella clausii]